jgi:hypothetical protein
MTLPRWPLLARGALLVGTLSAAGLALVGLREEPARSEQGYTCPMHPEVRRGEPGDCPVCGMALVRTAPPVAEPAAGAGARPRLPPGATEVVRRRVLTERRSVPAWVDAHGTIQALVPAEEVPHLAAGERAEFRSSRDGVPIPVTRVSGPVSPHDDATSEVPFHALSGAAAPAGGVGWLSLSDRSRSVVILPSAAVLLSEHGPAVLVPSRGPAGVERRSVRLGQSPDGLAVVVSGLEEDERVVVRGAFFLDAERRLRSSPAVPGR